MSIRWLTAFLDLPAPTYDAGVAFWREVTGTSLSPSRGEQDEFATLLPPAGDAYLRVQRVESGSGGVHLDLHVEDLTAFAWRAVSLGAKEVAREEGELIVLTSPGGFTFCVVGWRGETVRPEPTPGVVDQVCLDISPSWFEDECVFWHDLTEWDLRAGSRPEFVVLARPSGQPIRLLLQRLDDVRPGPVSAHLDLAAGDEVAGVVRRNVGLGARPVRDTGSWVTLRDPVGREYCVTSRVPKTGGLAH